MKITVRQEQPNDYKKTEQVVKNAFIVAEHSDGTEHKLVERLRKADGYIPELSLVAVRNEEIIGHVLLTPITVNDEDHKAPSLALAPVSVVPKAQKQGVGKQLIHQSLQAAKEKGYTSVIVLGDPLYYGKFGFLKASTWGINAPFEVPEDAFMALELEEGALQNVRGTVEYPQAFME